MNANDSKLAMLYLNKISSEKGHNLECTYWNSGSELNTLIKSFPIQYKSFPMSLWELCL